MEFEFDLAKDEANRFKHGLKLAFGERGLLLAIMSLWHRPGQSTVRIGSRR